MLHISNCVTSKIKTSMTNKAHFQDTFNQFLDDLKQQYTSEEAIQRLVGGEFKAAGLIACDLLRYYGLQDTHHLIDVGCGSGRIAIPLSQQYQGSYQGMDVLKELVDYAEQHCQRPDWCFLQSDGFTIPAEPKSADFIIFFSVFTHLLHEESFHYLQQSAKILRPNGKIIFSFLEFADENHWPVFENNVQDVGGRQPLNIFISREAIEVWAKKLGLKVLNIHSGSDAFVPLSQSVTLENGETLQNHAACGQAVCVLTHYD